MPRPSISCLARTQTRQGHQQRWVGSGEGIGGHVVYNACNVTASPGSDPCRAARRRGGARPAGRAAARRLPRGAAAKVTTRRGNRSARPFRGRRWGPPMSCAVHSQRSAMSARTLSHRKAVSNSEPQGACAPPRAALVLATPLMEPPASARGGARCTAEARAANRPSQRLQEGPQHLPAVGRGAPHAPRLGALSAASARQTRPFAAAARGQRVLGGAHTRAGPPP